MRRAIALVATLTVVAACGGGSGAPTTTPTTAAPTTTIGSDPTWFDGLGAGICFDDVFAGDVFDFDVPAAIVPCARPHDNEVVALVEIPGDADGDHPGDEAAEAEANARCDVAFETFLGRPLDETALQGFVVYPSQSDWDNGARHAVCAVYFGEPLVGTAASASLTVDGMQLAVLHEVGGRLDVWLLDAATGELTENVTSDFPGSLLRAPVSWAGDGTVIAFAGITPGGDGGDLYLASMTGLGIVLLLDAGGQEDRPVIAPVGTAVAFISDAQEEEFEIYVVDLENDGEILRVTVHEDRDSSPAWSPDGSQIVFRRRTDGNSDIYVMNADGSDVRQLTDDPAFDGDPHWSPDGSEIVFTSDRSGNYDIWVMSADGSNQTQLTDHPADEEYPWWSPDGEYIAFHSKRHGATQVWIMRWDGTEISLLSGDAPVGYPSWSTVPSDG